MDWEPSNKPIKGGGKSGESPITTWLWKQKWLHPEGRPKYVNPYGSPVENMKKEDEDIKRRSRLAEALKRKKADSLTLFNR